MEGLEGWDPERLRRAWERLLGMYMECIEALGNCTIAEDVEILKWTEKANMLAEQIKNIRELIVTPLPEGRVITTVGDVSMTVGG